METHERLAELAREAVILASKLEDESRSARLREYADRQPTVYNKAKRRVHSWLSRWM